MSKKNVIAETAMFVSIHNSKAVSSVVSGEEKRLRIERAMAGCEAKDAVSRFNYHLDNCKQCRENPFNLCEVGYSLISDAGYVPF